MEVRGVWEKICPTWVEQRNEKKCLLCWSSKSMRSYGGKAGHHWCVLPSLWANADRWALEEGTRCTNNTLICLGCNSKGIAANVIKLWLLVMVTCNQGKDLLRPIDSDVCSSPTWELSIHTSVSLVLFCPRLFHLGGAKAGLYSRINTFILIMLNPHQSCWFFFRKQ